MRQVKLTDLIDVQNMQNVQDAFSEYTGVAALITDEKGRPLTVGSNFARLCMDMVRKTEQGFEQCEECYRRGAEECMRTGKASVYDCHAGLVEFAVPISVEGKMVGCFIGGQVRNYDKPDEELRGIARSLGLDEEAFLEETRQTRIFTREEVIKAAIYLRKMGKALSGFAYQSYLAYQASRNEEEAALSRSNYMEGLYTDMAGDIKEWTRQVDVALESGDSREYERIMREMQTRGRDVSAFIRDTLVTIRQKNMSLHLMESVYSPAEILAEVSASLQPYFSQKQNELTTGIDEAVPKLLYGDTQRILRILTALLYEACRNTDHGQVQLEIGMRRQGYAVYPEIRIADSETGCQDARYDRIEEYLQNRMSKEDADTDSDTASEVMRAELSTVDTLLGQMFGGLVVICEKGKGNTVWLSFPQLEVKGRDNVLQNGKVIRSEKRI